MPAIFDLLYREYCRARLAEMRKQLLIRSENQALPESNWNVSQPDGAGDQACQVASDTKPTTVGKIGA